MEGSFSTDHRPQWAVVPIEEEERRRRRKNNNNNNNNNNVLG
jgi:hypothetical protein